MINYKIKNLVKFNTIQIGENFYFFDELKKFFSKRETEKSIEKCISYFLEIVEGKYDFIIFDLSKNNFALINKEIIKNGNKNFIITEPELLGIKEMQRLLKKYIYCWKIDEESLHIVCNRSKSFSMNRNLISRILHCENKILEIKENKVYHFCTNYFVKKTFLEKSKIIKREIERIIKVINV